MANEARKMWVGGTYPWRMTPLRGGCALAALLIPVAASAQSAPAADTGVQEIVVTAQKRAERLENVPVSVVQLTADSLQKANITNLQDISRITAGFQMDHAGGFQQASIRGVTALTNGVGNESNVAYYIDGVFYSDALTLNTDLANIESIQVLKGPQGTLYGRQASGGAILIKTLDPTDELTGKFDGSYGRFHERKLSGYLSAPLTDSIKFLVSGNFRNSDGYIKLSDPNNNQRSIGPAAPQKQRSFRSKLQIDVTNNLKATLAYNYLLSSDGKGILFTPEGHIPATVPGGNARAVGFYSRSYNYKTIVSAEMNEETLKLEWKTGIGTLTSLTGYKRLHFHNAFDTDGVYADTTYSEQFQGEKTTQQALDYVIDAIDHVDLIVGGLYYKDHYFVEPQASGAPQFGPNRLLLYTSFRDLKTKAYAGYVDATIHFTDALSLGVGGRYNVDKKTASQGGVGFAIPSPFPNVAPASKTFRKFTPRVTLRYELAPRTNVYASFSQGYRSGGYNTGQVPSAIDAVRIIKPEVLTAYEVGFKTAQRTFRFETAAYYYDYKNLQTQITSFSTVTQQVSTITSNVPKAKVYGLDVQGTITPVENLNITAGGAYIHGRYGYFPNASGTGVNATNTLNVGSQTQDWSGNQLPRAPTFSGNLNGDYTMDVAGGALRISGNARYTTSFVINNPSTYGPLAPADLQHKQRFRQPGYLLLNGAIDWTDPTGHYSVGVFGTNLTNRKYKLSNTTIPLNGDYFTPGPPISYGVRVGYKL